MQTIVLYWIRIKERLNNVNIYSFYLFIFLQGLRKRSRCQGEWITIECPHRPHLIRIHSAVFGNRGLGIEQCPNTDTIDCESDVEYTISDMCNGKDICLFKVTNRYYDDLDHPCPTGIHSYLALEYTCECEYISNCPSDTSEKCSGIRESQPQYGSGVCKKHCG